MFQLALMVIFSAQAQTQPSFPAPPPAAAAAPTTVAPVPAPPPPPAATPAPLLQAEPSPEVSSPQVLEVEERGGYNEGLRGIWFFLGGGIGYMNVSTDFSNEDTKDGMYYDVRGTLSAYFNDFFMTDVSFGWNYTRVGRDAANGNEIIVNTRTAFADIVPSFRFSENWSVGPVIHFNFGADNSLAESVSDNSEAWYVGARFGYSMPLDNLFAMRFFAEFNTDIDVDARQAYVGILGIQLGIGGQP